MNQSNEILIKYIKDSVKKNLGEDKTRISKFFKYVFSKKFDCIVFVSRRCYIIYLIFSILENWEYEDVFVCTDLGIFGNRDKFQKGRNVAVVDDIEYTGTSLEHILKTVKKYVPVKCNITAMLYAMNKKGSNKLTRKHTFCKGYMIKSQLWLTELQCKRLSIRLVKTILDSGVPYTTFVYPIMGRLSNEMEDEFEYSSNTKYKSDWIPRYLEISNTKENSNLLFLGNYSVIRTYKNRVDSNTISFLPFIFLKKIKPSKVDFWFKKIAHTFYVLGSKKFSKEIYEALSVKHKWRTDALVYLASFFSCFCSKALAELCGLEHYLYEYDKSAEKTFERSFSVEALKIIKECDKEYAELFFEELFKDKKSIEEFFYENLNEKKGRKLYEALTKYIEVNCNNENVYETTKMIYSWLKQKNSDKFFKKGEVKALSLDDLVYILKTKINCNYEDIFLAEIECWDLGIATYRFCFDKRNGLFARCTAGEMSTTLDMIKYQYIIQQFYQKRYCNEEPFLGMKRSELLNLIMEKAFKEGKYTESEIANFRKILEERKGSLLGLLI